MIGDRSDRRAVVIGVEQFGVDPGDDEEPDLTAHPELRYVPKLASQLDDILAKFGYDSELVLDKSKTIAKKLGRRIRGQGRKHRLDPAAVRLVCVLSHGERPIGGTDGLVIIGSDGQSCQDTDVAAWLTERS